MSVYIGTSGYVYDHWEGSFYPKEMGRDSWFDYYAKQFVSVEINNTFYHLPEAETFRQWREQAPGGFLYAVKASRYLTHRKKLKDPDEPWRRFWERARHLESHGGPVLFQLPPHWKRNPDRLEAFLEILPKGVRAAFEFRDPSWHDESIYERLDAAGCALCVHDMEGSAPPRRAAGAFVYCRFHGSEGAYKGRYGRNRLRPWARWLREQGVSEGRDVYAYFNNDEKGYAPKDARALRDLLEE